MQRFPFPLKFSIPIILILSGGLLGLFSFQREIADNSQKTENMTQNYVSSSSSRTAGILDYLFRQKDQEEAENVLSQLGSDPSLNLALLLDEKNSVLMSNHYELRFQPVQKTPADQYSSRFVKVRSHRAGELIFSQDRDKLIAIYSVLLPATPGELNTSKIGILYLEYDLRRAKQEALNNALNKSLVLGELLMLFCLGLWVFFERTLTRRVTQLVLVSNSLSEGKLDIRAGLSGSDEIAQIAAAFDRMAEKIQENTRDLEESEERYNLAVSGTNDGIWDWNIQTNAVYYSPVWFKILGYSGPDNLPSVIFTVTQMIHPEDRDSVEQAVRDHLMGMTEVYQHTHWIQHKDGHYIWIASKGKCLLDEAGKPYRMVGTITDITEKKQAQEELKKAKESAEIANQAKSNFLARMSHELRTPLTAILGFTDLVARDNSLSKTNKKYLETISRSGQHLLSLINDILKMSQIEAGQITINKNSFDLYSLLYLIRDMFTLKIASKGIELRLEIDPQVPQYIDADQGKIRQILLNLINNAVKFTLEGYILILVRATKEASNWVLEMEVKDTGIGIPTSDFDLIFEPFKQTKQGYNQEGTGLGLSISRQFARLMGGDITVESLLGQGSTFSCFVPIVASNKISTSPINQKVLGLQPGQASYRILVVEDVLENSQLIVKLMESIGLKVASAQNGLEAIKIWQSWQPHLIWMDIQMPKMDGFEATRQIRLSPEGEKTIIIALSAHAFIEDEAAILKAGFNDFVSKPFARETLFSRMEYYLGLKYIYSSESIAEPYLKKSSFNHLNAKDLECMGKDWLQQMNEAAILLDEVKLHKLISEIPERNQKISDNLKNLLNEFQFEEIMKLTQPS